MKITLEEAKQKIEQLQARTSDSSEALGYHESLRILDRVETPEPRKMEWQPIETAPRDGTRIIGAGNGTEPCVYRWHKAASKWSIVYSNAPAFQPTHWMPLPEPLDKQPEPVD